MTDPEIFRLLSSVVFVGASVFIAVFATEPWARTHFGRSLMVMAVAVWLFSLTSVLRQWFGPDYAGRTELRIVANSLVVYAVWSRLFTLIAARKNFRRRQDIS